MAVLKISTLLLVTLVIAFAPSTTEAGRGGGNCPAFFKEGEVFKCVDFRKDVGRLGTLTVWLRKGLVIVKFNARRGIKVKKVLLKLACDGGRPTGPTLRARGRGSVARVRAPQTAISCNKSCCDRTLVIKVIKVIVCKRIRKHGRRRFKCFAIRNQLLSIGRLSCEQPCGYPTSPLLKVVLTPCPMCVCKDDPSIKAPGGDDSVCKKKCDCDPRYYKCDRYTDYECVCKEDCCSDDDCDKGYICKDYKCVKKCDCDPLYYKCDEYTDYKCECKKDCCSDDDCDKGYVCKDYQCVKKCDCDPLYYKCDEYTDYKCECKKDCCSDDDCDKGYVCKDYECVKKCDCDPLYYKCDEYTDYKCECKKDCCSDDDCDKGYVCKDYECVKKCDCDPRYYKCDEYTDYKCECKEECCSDDDCDSGYRCKNYRCKY